MNTDLAQKLYQAEIETGRAFAPEFIAALGETAKQALADWLEANGLPTPVMDLLDSLVMLERCATYAECGRLPDPYAAFLAQSLADVTQQITALGGSFYGPDLQHQPDKAAPYAIP